MLTELSLKCFNVIMREIEVTSVAPFEWNPVTQRMYVTRKKGRLALWILQVIWLGGLAVNMSISLYSGYSEGVDMARVTFDLLFAMAYILLLVFNLNVILARHGLAQFVTKFMEFDRTLTESTFEEAHPLKNDGFQVIALLCHFMKTITIPVVAGFFLLNVNHPRYLYRWLPEKSKSVLTIGLYFLHEWYLHYALTLLFFFLAFIVIIYANMTNFWLKTLLSSMTRGGGDRGDNDEDKNEWIGKKKQEMATTTTTNNNNNKKGVWKLIQMATADSTKPPAAVFGWTNGEKFRVYGGLQMLNILFNQSHSKLFWPSTIILVILMQSFGLYGCIKLYDVVPPLLFPIFPLILFGVSVIQVAIFPLVGNINFFSTQFLPRFGDPVFNSLDKPDRLRVKDLRPLATYVANVMTINQLTILEIIINVSNTTINFILMH